MPCPKLILRRLTTSFYNGLQPVDRRGKPTKPYPDYPLTAHPAGYWCKKIRGKLHYFGPWDDPHGALAKFEEQKQALYAGRKPRPDAEVVTVKYLVNAFLTHKRRLMDVGEITPRVWADYETVGSILLERFGKYRIAADLGTEDFAELRKKMAARWGPVTLGNTIQRIRSIFKYGYDSGLLEQPMRFGPVFARPSKKVLRLHQVKKGSRVFEADELWRMLDTATVPLKAMLLLGMRCFAGDGACATEAMR